MQKKAHQNKEFCTLLRHDFSRPAIAKMHKPRSINELLTVGGKRLTHLKAKTEERMLAVEHVRAALPPKLAEVVVSAGLNEGHLTIGVTGATWASRLRYVTETLRMRVGGSMRVNIQSIRIKVVPPRA